MQMRYSRSNSKNPAHIYLVAERACNELKSHTQTIVITGESGAGKTEVARLCLDYVASKISTMHNNEGAGIERTLHTNPY